VNSYSVAVCSGSHTQAGPHLRDTLAPDLTERDVISEKFITCADRFRPANVDAFVAVNAVTGSDL
jgi:hypothetical protein